MNLTGEWLQHPGTQAVFHALETAGHATFFVGGAVRNALLGLPVADVDLATNAPPDAVDRLCTKAGLRVVPTGIDHGTVTVIAAGRAHEVTTLRRDVETDGRRAKVSFDADLAQDAARRDFTMNAIYADGDGRVIDPLGGLVDALARHVRFVGDPDARIAEDYLRILRFFRFHAVYGDAAAGIDADGLAAATAHSAGLETISRERIGAEMRKLLQAGDPAPAVASMATSGVLACVLPGADPSALAPLIHQEAGLQPRWQRRLAVLGGQDLADALRLSRQEAATMKRLREAVGTTETSAVLGWRHGDTLGTDAVLARAAMQGAALPKGWQAEVARGAASHLPVSAADFPALSGSALGAQLKQVQARWLASDLHAERSQLLDK